MPDFSLENSLSGIIAGFDEVGRGPLAGPVVAAAVILDPLTLPPRLLAELNDSKKLSAKRREELSVLVWQSSSVGLGVAEVREIDSLNILQATFVAMVRAHDDLIKVSGKMLDWALVDGNQIPVGLPCSVKCVVGGDGLSLSIAAASVVAKVYRDRLMADLAVQFPGYGWERNSGYGSAAHMAALDHIGPTPHHRRSFAPVARAEAKFRNLVDSPYETGR